MGDLRAGQRQYQEGILLPLHFLALPSEAAWTTEWSQECGLLSSGNSIGVVFGRPATAVASREQGASDRFDLTFLSSRVDGHRVSCWKEDTGCRIS